MLNAAFESCYSELSTYLRLGGATTTRVTAYPIAAKRPDGRVGVRCDIAVDRVTGNTAYVPPAVTRASLAGAIRSGNPWVWRRCTDDSPVVAPEHLTSCGRPHRAEALAGQVQLQVEDRTYPTAAVLAARGRALCRRQVSGYPEAKQLALTTTWQTALQWRRSGRQPQLFGACWVSRRDHGDLPARG